MTFWSFAIYSIGAIAAPRVAFALFIVVHFQDQWSIAVAILCLMNAGTNRARINTAKYILNGLSGLIRGKDVIVENVVEKVVEREVEKIVYRYKYINVRVRDLTVDEAASCLGCEKNDSQEKLALGYKNMIKRVHPDMGGSTYLAAIVNQAKVMLLK